MQTAGIKLYDNRALISKRNSAIAFALLDIFTTYGAPAILQSDYGGEFQAIAHKNKSKTLEITDVDLDEIISEIKHVWPQCTMVCGRPRHSQSQGGIERLNCTCQTKLGSWMHDNNSKNWSIGRLFVRWQINTQHSQAVNDVPYRLAFGQLPRVGISALPLSAELLSTLSTEADLNKALRLNL